MKTIIPFIKDYFNYLLKLPLFYFTFKGVVSITGLSLWMSFVLYLLVVLCFVLSDLSDRVFGLGKEND
jgi:hypothetical protein